MQQTNFFDTPSKRVMTHTLFEALSSLFFSPFKEHHAGHDQILRYMNFCNVKISGYFMASHDTYDY